MLSSFYLRLLEHYLRALGYHVRRLVTAILEKPCVDTLADSPSKSSVFQPFPLKHHTYEQSCLVSSRQVNPRDEYQVTSVNATWSKRITQLLLA